MVAKCCKNGFGKTWCFENYEEIRDIVDDKNSFHKENENFGTINHNFKFKGKNLKTARIFAQVDGNYLTILYCC